MRATSFLLTIPVALLLSSGIAEAKDTVKEKHNHVSHKSAADNEIQAGKEEGKEWKRSTEGHPPQDLNGDGIISRNEWPGNDASFRELDSDGDGVLTNRDKRYGLKRMHERPVNNNKKAKKK